MFRHLLRSAICCTNQDVVTFLPLRALRNQTLENSSQVVCFCASTADVIVVLHAYPVYKNEVESEKLNEENRKSVFENRKILTKSRYSHAQLLGVPLYIA